MLADVLRPGALYSPSPLSRMVPGTMPPPAAVLAPAALSQGQVFVPVPGIPGRDGTSTIQKTALVALGGHRVVIQGASGPEYADSAVPDHQDRVLGLTLGASAAGALSTIARSGEVVEPSWNWQLGPVFLGHNGLLTQIPPTPPDAAFLLTLGFATAPTTLFLAPREPVTLKE